MKIKTKVKTEWDLGLLYKSEKDPEIEKDLKAVEKACSAFEKKYKNADYTSTPEQLAKALNDYEKLQETFKGNKAHWYFSLKVDLNSGDSKNTAKATQLEQRITAASNKTKFFNLKIGKIEKSKQEIFLKNKSLASFTYKLKKIFNNAKYRLTEEEEQLEDLLSQTSYTMWVDGQEKILNQETVSFEGKEIPISEASSKMASLPKKERRELDTKVVEKLKSISGFAEAEINAIYNYKKTMDERRGYKAPYSDTVLSYENEEKNVENLVSLITKNFHISQRFYRLHAKLLKEKKLKYSDRGVKVGKIEKIFPFNEALSITRKALGRVDEKYADILDNFVSKGQIDVYPKKGKRGGAYCSGRADLPTFVLLNHVDEIRSVETLGHEMGHAIHTEMSKGQPLRYRYFSIATAEVASTFFEQITIEEIEKTLSEKERVIMLHNKIMGDINTVFRQIACFNFELELHNRIRKEGQVAKENIAELLAKHMRAYLGSAVEVTGDDGYAFVSWPHLRYFFYVYSYSYGQLISRALFEKWKKDPSFATKIEQFLKAGRSMSPEDIFKSIGIDTSKSSFFEAGLKGIEADIARLEKLTSKI